jgi:hypothetical protein
MKKNILWVVVIISLLYFKGESKAYSVDKAHQHLTKIALNVYGFCANEVTPSNQKTNFNEKIIIDANIEEDEGHWLLRIFNWHFYYPERNKYRKGIFIKETLDRTFDGLIKGLISEPPQKKGYEILGRVLHFIEDVTVPAHVVPVYHSINLPWLNGTKRQLKISDGVDSYDNTSIVETEEFFKKEANLLLKELTRTLQKYSKSYTAEGKTLCQNFHFLISNDLKNNDKHSPLFLEKILNETALETRARVKEPICKVNGVDGPNWHYFWNEPKEGYFFGRYLNDDENAFNSEFRPKTVSKITDSGKIITCQMLEPKNNLYDKFVERAYMNAVIADIRVLFLLEDFLKNLPVKGK